MQRTLNAPDQEYLNDIESAQWLGIPLDTFRRLCRLGVIPKGIEYTRKTERWFWLTILAVGQLMPHLLKLTEEAPAPTAKGKKIAQD